MDGKSYEGMRVTTTDIEVLLLLDSNHRLMRLEVPSAKVSVIREYIDLPGFAFSSAS